MVADMSFDKTRVLLLCVLTSCALRGLYAQGQGNGNFENGLRLLPFLTGSGLGGGNGTNALTGLVSSLLSGNNSNTIFELLRTFLKPNVTTDEVVNTALKIPEIQNVVDLLKGENTTRIEFVKNILKDLGNPSPNKSTQTTDNYLAALLKMVGIDPSMVTNVMKVQKHWVDTTKFVQYAVSPRCINTTMSVMEGLAKGKQWALRMIDSFGKPESGFLTGKYMWIGSYQECIDITEKVIRDESADMIGLDAFNGNFCISTTKLGEGPMGPLNLGIGMCFPDVCSTIDKAYLVGSVYSFIASVPRLLQGNNATIVENQMYCQVQPDKREIDAPATAALIIIAILVLIIAACTTFDLIYHWVEKYETESSASVLLTGIDNGAYVSGTQVELQHVNEGDLKTPTETSENDSANGVANGTVNGEMYIVNSTAKVDEPIEKVKKEKGVLISLLLSLSAYTCTKKLMGTNQPAGALECLNGIRFISMAWVILGHTIALTPYQFGLVGNVVDVFGWMKEFHFQAVANATVSVDSFFLLSATLVTYLSLKMMKKKNGFGVLDWALFYFHRYIRLTPPYMLVIMVYYCLQPYMGSGPFWSTYRDVNCETNWWANLIYLQNIIHPTKQCMGWSWYLANDMQLFVFTPLLLIPLYYRPSIGIIWTASLAIGSVICRGVLSGVNNLGAGMSMIPAEGQTSGGDVWSILYVVPWSRASAYMVGVLLGYILYKYKDKIKLNWSLSLLLWLVAASFCIGTLYGLHSVYSGTKITVAVAAIYNALWRFTWSLGVAWVILACCTGHGGVINEFLSWSGFVPLARLTYCAYLVHPILMNVFFLGQPQLIMINHVNLIYYYFAFLVASYGAAFATSLVFESPWLGIEKTLLGLALKKKK